MKTNISIGIIALNEEDNIIHLLKSICMQKQNSYFIKEIVIISDGSTDNTVKLIKEFNDTRVNLLIYKKRVGKSQHLNTLFKIIKNDVVVLFDADVILSSPHTIEHLVSGLLTNKNIGLVGGNPQPIPGKTFVEKAINYSFYAYDPLRSSLNSGNNAYGCDGRILALKRSFFQQSKSPLIRSPMMHLCFLVALQKDLNLSI